MCETRPVSRGKASMAAIPSSRSSHRSSLLDVQKAVFSCGLGFSEGSGFRGLFPETPIKECTFSSSRIPNII